MSKSVKRKTGPKISLEEKRSQAYDLYMTTDKLQKEIASIVGVGADTLGEWIRTKGWKNEKAARTITKDRVIANNLAQILNLQEDINKRAQKWPTAAESQTITMLSNVIDQLSGKVSLPTYIHVFDQFLKFLHKVNPAAAKSIADHTLEFVQSKARELSR